MPFHTSADLDRHLEAEHDDVIEDEDMLDEDMLAMDDGTDGKKIVVSAEELVGSKVVSTRKFTPSSFIIQIFIKFLDFV